ncbi:MAG: hypothetical protein II769_04475, partial [Oscillospiraceae bacterium]|nr:hypothetical protein [Oscillospiraceae bacterium]
NLNVSYCDFCEKPERPNPEQGTASPVPVSEDLLHLQIDRAVRDLLPDARRKLSAERGPETARCYRFFQLPVF